MNAVIVAGVVALAAIMHLLAAHERTLAASESFVISVAERLAAIDRLLTDHPMPAGDVAAAFGAPGFEVRLERAPPRPPPREWSHGAEIRGMVQERADLFRDDRMTVYFPHDRGRPPEPRVELALARDAGGFLVARASSSALQSSFHALSTSTLLAVFAIAVAMLAMARGALRHLAPFARAAEALGAGADAPGLPEQRGPREIRELAVAFNAMQHRIRTQRAERAVMLAAVSHDLRTFLTRFALRADFITDPEQHRKAEGDIAEMTTLLENLIAYARDAEGEEPVARIDVATLIVSLVSDAEDLGHCATYEGPAHLSMRARPVALKRALANLIDNAVRYGGRADVQLSLSEARIRIVVADRGPGIPPDARERLLAPFERLDASRSRDTGGSGLGLTIAHTVIGRHGGTLTFADRAGGGLEVRLDLPVG
jgi:signal transduction histidine kinase